MTTNYQSEEEKDMKMLGRYLKMRNAHDALLNIFKLLELDNIIMDYHAGPDSVELEGMEVNSRKYNMKKLWKEYTNMEKELYNKVCRYLQRNSDISLEVPSFSGYGVYEQGSAIIKQTEENGTSRISSYKDCATYYFCMLHYYVNDKHIEEEDKKVLIDFFGPQVTSISVSEDLLTSASSNNPKKREEAIDEIMEDIILSNITGGDTIYTKEESEKAAKVLLKYIVPCYKASIDSILNMIDNTLIDSSYDYHYPEISIDIYQHEGKYNISLGILWSVNTYADLITMGLHETEVIPFPTQSLG